MVERGHTGRRFVLTKGETYFVCGLPEAGSPGPLEDEFVREFPSLPRIEGIAAAGDGDFFYVTDEDEGVHLRLTRLLGSEGE